MTNSNLPNLRLVLAAYWTNEPNGVALDKTAKAFAPLKAPDTQGYAILYSEKDPEAQLTYDAIKKHVEDESKPC